MFELYEILLLIKSILISGIVTVKELPFSLVTELVLWESVAKILIFLPSK